MPLLSHWDLTIVLNPKPFHFTGASVMLSTSYCLGMPSESAENSRLRQNSPEISGRLPFATLFAAMKRFLSVTNQNCVSDAPTIDESSSRGTSFGEPFVSGINRCTNQESF